MKEHGLTLNLSIEEDSFRPEDYRFSKADFYKIGVWIKHPVQLNQEVLLRRLKRLGEDIITPVDYRPRLGGSYQDKVCAAMLFNNTFTSVQNQHSAKDKWFYPWLKAGSSPVYEGDAEEVDDWEISWNVLENDVFSSSKSFFESTYEAHLGYYKKFFWIWKGEDVLNYDDFGHFSSAWENLSRFKIISFPKTGYWRL